MNERLLIIDVASIEDVKARTLAAFRGEAATSARHSFISHDLLLRTLTPGRWKLIETLTGSEPLGLRELARRAGRDVKGVHTDAQALVSCGLIDRTDDAKYSFPYDEVDVHFAVKPSRRAA